MDKIKTIAELKALCKERKIKGFSGKTKKELCDLLGEPTVPPNPLPATENHIIAGETTVPPDPLPATENHIISPVTEAQVTEVDINRFFVDGHAPSGDSPILRGDSIKILPTLKSESAQIIIADPPYNIGKDFGNNSDKQPMDEYLVWCEQWIKECIRILKPNGTMFIYGFSEILAMIYSKIPQTYWGSTPSGGSEGGGSPLRSRWIVWHYTNKTVPSLHFWQRTHESIIVIWKSDKVFHRDDVREPYTDGFLNGAAGKERKATKGRFSKGDKTTTYEAHANGALPRDVIKIPALAGGAGMNERVDHPTQKPLALCDKLIRSCRQPATEGYVLVPFAGSGSECVAAKKNGIPFIGIELNPVYVKLCEDRLAGAAAPRTPPASP
jgi:site-specific DNA-methyltransferase (adenine-specific)